MDKVDVSDKKSGELTMSRIGQKGKVRIFGGYFTRSLGIFVEGLQSFIQKCETILD